MLSRSTPESQGIPSATLVALVDRLEAEGLEPHSLMLLRSGHVVAEGWWRPYHRDGVQLVYSLSKSFTSAAVGLAVADGAFALTDRLSGFFPDAAAGAGPRASRLTVHDALSMSTGHRVDTMESMAGAAQEWERAFFESEPEEEAGSWFVYNNGATFMVGAVAQQRTGERLLDYLRPRLLDPLGIEQAAWLQAPDGRDLAFSGLHVTTESIARLGQLLLDDGRWQGRRLLPEGWVATATSALTDNSMNDAGPDWQQGYGYQFWRCRHDAYRGDGAFGQFALVLPGLDTVLALTACTEDMQAILDAVWEILLPALGPAPLPRDDDAHGRLTARLAAARVAPVHGGAAPASGGPWHFTHQPTDEHPALRSVLVRPGPAGSGRTDLLIDDGGEVEVPCLDGDWPEADGPFVASGGWTAPGVFEARVVARETPHHLLLRCADGAVTAGWNGVPLHAPVLSHLVAPRP